MIGKLDRILENLENPHNKNKVEQLFEVALANKTLITRFDIIRCFGIKVTTFNQVQSRLREASATFEEVEKVKEIITKIGSYDKAIAMINDKVIKAGSRISKNTMAYLLREEKEENDLVIINVSVNNEKENVTLDKILKSKEK